jgi:hypothetical protein
LQHCVIEQNVAGYVDAGRGGGLYIHILAENYRIVDNGIVNNYAGDEGGGIFARGNGEIRGNYIARNGCHVGGGGVRLGSVLLADNLIHENWSDHFGGGILILGGEARGNTVVGNIGPAGGAGIDIRAGLAANNIVVGNRGPGSEANGVRCLGGGPFAPIECNNAWDNTGDQYGGCDSLSRSNISVDPRFCDDTVGSYHLRPGSPCAAENNPSCGLMGAFPVDPACAAVPARRVTWGMLKRTYR